MRFHMTDMRAINSICVYLAPSHQFDRKSAIDLIGNRSLDNLIGDLRGAALGLAAHLEADVRVARPDYLAHQVLSLVQLPSDIRF